MTPPKGLLRRKNTNYLKAKGRFHHEGPKDTKKSINHQALFKPEAENISHGDHGADTEEHGELKLKNVTNFRLRLREA